MWKKEKRQEMEPLAEVRSSTNYFDEMLTALETGDDSALRSAVSHLSTSELNRCFTHARLDAFDIPANSLPQPIQEDLCTQDEINIGAVHYAANKGYKLCLQILLEGGADPNLKDSFGQTALHVLAKSFGKYVEGDYVGCLQVLLAQERIDRRSLDLSMSTPLSRAEEVHWEYMMEKMKSEEDDFSAVGHETSRKLWKFLTENNFHDFRSEIYKVNDTIINQSYGAYTLLQYACKLGRYEYVIEILSSNASPSCKHDMNILSPIMWASKLGYYKILSQLIKHMKPEDLQNGALKERSYYQETPLHYVVKCEHAPQHGSHCDYLKCLYLLLTQKDYIDIDASDTDGNTALHYAAMCTDLTAFSTLLNEADFTVTNAYGRSPLHYLCKEGINTVLNNCVEFDRKKKLIQKDFWVGLNYKMMDTKHTRSAITELDFLNILSKIHKDKEILHHPVLDIFMHLKWQTIKTCFYLNFAAHILFLALLISYICLYHMSLPQNTDNNTETDAREQPDLQMVFSISVFIALILKEVAQFLVTVSWKNYIYDIKYIIEVITAIFSVVLLFAPVGAKIKMGIAAWLSLGSLTEFILHLGCLPAFAVYITMFKAVTWNFFKFICLFSSMIFAFSLSFYLMFQSSEKFRPFPESLVKTLFMSMGEVEYSELPKDVIPICSHIMMILFVFLIMLVLVNLLNGLAITDIQDIRKQAEVISCTSLIDRTSQLERAFHCSDQNPLKRIFNWLFDTTTTFKTCLPGHKLMIYINSSTIGYSHNDEIQTKSICKCHHHKLKIKHIEALKDVIMEKKNRLP
ncbi:hypothetical protein SK128_025457 [Halocaridina rubra]|uniref:Ion transport domain-containing protein n=1 Tax=Halocaridina rubra TaxID=373956 RepID=A0AAN9AD85_HALRR